MGNGARGPTHDDVVLAWDVLLVRLETAAPWEGPVIRLVR
jgi:hypothetical protein